MTAQTAQELRSGADRRSEHAPVEVDRRERIDDRRAEYNLRLATFRIAGEMFAIDVMRVQEVVLAQPMTQVPLAAPELRGLVNLRGQVVPAFDMRRILGYPPFALDDEPINMIVTHREGLMSLLVDEQGDYLEVSRSHYQVPPRTVDAALAAHLLGVCELPEFLLMILDVDRVIDGSESHESEERDSAR